MRNTVLIVAGLLLLAAGGVTYGATRDAGQTITACVEPANNQLFLAPAGGCPGGQQTLSWNQQGPQGVQGVQGIQGPAGENGISSAANAVVGVVTVKYKRQFATSIDVDGVGTHLVSGHVHVEVDPSKWKRDGHVNCQLADADGTLDSSVTPVVHGGSAQKFDIDLDGFVTIEPAPSSQTVQSIAPTDKTVYFKCQTIMPATSVSLAPIFSFVRMSDELLKASVVKLPVKVAVKIGP